MPRHASTHAAGVVITRKPVYEYVPLAKNDESVVCQYIMTTLEELGLLKMDFLGLRNLTVLDDAVKMVQTSGSRTSTRMTSRRGTRRPTKCSLTAKPTVCSRWNPPA